MKLLMIGLVLVSGAHAADYLVAVPKDAADGWSEVAEALAKVHNGEVVKFSGKADDLLTQLKDHHPRFLAVVGAPEIFDGVFVRAINRISRKVDDDPFADVRWGLVTGPTPKAAMQVVKSQKPLIIDRALTTTGINMELIESGLTLSDGKKGDYTVKKKGGKPENLQWDQAAAPGGTEDLFAKAWSENKPQLLVTSSHATQYNLEMPFGLGLIASYGGKFHVLTQQQLPQFAKFLGGVMFTGDPSKLGAWLAETKVPVLADSVEPKVWVAAGNCLIGDARKTADSMVVTALGSGGVRQFVGYVVPTWYGEAGWGTLKTWQESKGGLSLSEAFYLNGQKIIDRTQKRYPGALDVNFDADDIETCMKTDRKFNEALQKLKASGVPIEKDTVGLIHDRDVVAFWGDPAWDARFDSKRLPHPLTHQWKKTDDGCEMTLKAQADFEGEYPVCLPKRFVSAPEMTLPDGVEATVGDDFLLVNKIKLAKGASCVIKLKGKF